MIIGRFVHSQTTPNDILKYEIWKTFESNRMALHLTFQMTQLIGYKNFLDELSTETVNWLSSSCDLAPLNYSLWGMSKVMFIELIYNRFLNFRMKLLVFKLCQNVLKILTKVWIFVGLQEMVVWQIFFMHKFHN